MSLGDQVLQYLITGVSVGMVYGIVALGLTVVFNATGVINFAQGEFVMLGGMVAVALHGAGLPVWLAGILAVLIVTAVGILTERCAVYPMRGRPVVTIIIATIGASLALQGAAKLLWGPNAVRLPAFTGETPIRLAGAGLEPQRLWVMVLVALTMLAVHLFFSRTLTGKAMRAAAINRSSARLCGIGSDGMVRLAFAISAATAALAGVAVTPVEMMKYSQGAHYTLTGFLAAVVGGLGSGVGAVVGGVALGLLESFSKGYISSGYARAIALGVALLVLWLRPQGLLSRGRSR
jgi:branched-chain amino acid transport system permease protein